MNLLIASPAELIAYCRVNMVEKPFPGNDKFPSYSILQRKMDGWFTLIRGWGGQEGVIDIISSGAKIIKSIPYRGPNLLLVAEYMWGTNRAQDPAYKGKFYIHDGIFIDKTLIEDFFYPKKLPVIADFLDLHPLPIPVSVLPVFSRDKTDWLWSAYPDDEGIVIKEPWGFGPRMKAIKIKRNVDGDFVAMRFNEGAGRLKGTLGSIIGGQYHNDTLVEVLSVGGGFDDSQRREIWDHREKYIYKVFAASGKGKFPSGALRHPNFGTDSYPGGWRDDKLSKNCKK